MRELSNTAAPKEPPPPPLVYVPPEEEMLVPPGPEEHEVGMARPMVIEAVPDEGEPEVIYGHIPPP